MIDGLGTGLELPVALFLIGCVAAMVCALPWRRWVLCAAVLGWGGVGRAAVAWDSTNFGTATTADSVTVSMQAGETGMLCVECNNLSSLTGQCLASASGGGTWTKIGFVTIANSFSAGYYSTADLWATGASAATTAASVSFTPNTGFSAVSSVVLQYTGVVTIKSAGVQTNAGSGAGTVSVALTTTVAGSYISACEGMEAFTSTSLSAAAITGNLREYATFINTRIAAMMDNTGAGSVTNSMSVTATTYANASWNAVAVELAPAVVTSSSPLPLLFNFLLPAPWLVWDQAAQFPAP